MTSSFPSVTMMTSSSQVSWRRAGRIGWTILTICVVQGLVCGLSVLPVAVIWSWLIAWHAPNIAVRLMVFSISVAPSYVLFAFCLMVFSAASTRMTGWRTPHSMEMRITDVNWPLLNWVRHVVGIHVVRTLAGTVFRGSPIWTAYLRLSGARLGRRVYVNSLSVSDYNLLEFGDDVVIGADAHVSGHTVEAGVVKTASVRLGRNVTIGVGAIIDIDVEAGPDCQVGALSLVPKHTKLEAGAVYAGIPARRID
jgi:acetyltransferase-like isoleucine patch superfamily enzyme